MHCHLGAQVSFDNRWVFDAGDNPDETGTFATFIGLLEGLLMAVSSHTSY
jgi:hypothetical protein